MSPPKLKITKFCPVSPPTTEMCSCDKLCGGKKDQHRLYLQELETNHLIYYIKMFHLIALLVSEIIWGF